MINMYLLANPSDRKHALRVIILKSRAQQRILSEKLNDKLTLVSMLLYISVDLDLGLERYRYTHTNRYMCVHCNPSSAPICNALA